MSRQPHITRDALGALGGTAFREEGGEVVWSEDLGLPDTLAEFSFRLGPDAPLRARAVEAGSPYTVRYRLGGELWEECGVREAGITHGLLRRIGSVRPKLEPLSRDQLLRALNDRRVRLAFQPVVGAGDHAVHHFECLLRVHTEHNDVLPAVQVIASAEELGLVHLLDRRALETAARTLIGRPRLRLALNLSAQTVADGDAADDYLRALRMLGPATSRLTLELTETVAVSDPARVAEFSERSRRLGCRFSIDDFGSGHTSFRNLLAVEADQLKIDGQYVDDITTSRRSQSFVRMMVDLAETFGLETVAERVETPEVADLLEDLGVDLLQGYLFGRPSEATTVLKKAS